MLAFLAFAVEVLMAVAPSAGYAAQLIAVYTGTEGIEGYSLEVSYVLLGSQFLRILYFIAGSAARSSSSGPQQQQGTQGLSEGTGSQTQAFATTLLFQSLIMIVVQLALVITVLKTALRLRYKEGDPVVAVSGTGTGGGNSPTVTSRGPAFGTPAVPQPRKLLASERFRHFPTPREFVTKLAVLAVVGLCVMLPFWYDVVPAVWLGYFALGLESMLLLPQLLRNKQRQATDGVTWLLLFSWIGGDVLKTIYFIVNQQPGPFFLCVSIQLSLDTVLIYQLMAYRGQQGSSAFAGIVAED